MKKHLQEVNKVLTDYANAKEEEYLLIKTKIEIAKNACTHMIALFPTLQFSFEDDYSFKYLNNRNTIFIKNESVVFKEKAQLSYTDYRFSYRYDITINEMTISFVIPTFECFDDESTETGETTIDLDKKFFTKKKQKVVYTEQHLEAFKEGFIDYYKSLENVASPMLTSHSSIFIEANPLIKPFLDSFEKSRLFL